MVMNRRSGILAGILLAVSSTVFFLFIGFPLFNVNNTQTDTPFSNVRNNQDVSTIGNDIDACISNPTSDCDQEMQQLSKFCEQNKDQYQQYPFCSDSRIQMYLNHRNSAQIKVNGEG